MCVDTHTRIHMHVYVLHYDNTLSNIGAHAVEILITINLNGSIS